MITKFENLDVWYDDTVENGGPIIFACRDKEAICEERWVLASLSKDEARELYDYLRKYLK